ncbi:MAG: hypothetical protein EOP84_15730, partial [Verrucomicrobiaceae bacterium]
METNPNVEPDAPLPHDEATPQTTPIDNPPPEPAAASSPEIAAQEAVAEAIPEPMVEITMEQHREQEPSEDALDAPVAEPAPAEPSHEETEETPVNTSAEEPPALVGQEQEQEVTEPQSVGEPHPQPEGLREPETSDVTSEPQSAQPESIQGQEPVSAEITGISEETAAEGAQDPLDALANQAQRARLSPADEERATTLLKEALMDGRAGVIRAIAALPKLPWVIGVNAVVAVWPELKPVFRSQMLAGLVKTDGDAAKRMRLSLARGLFKQDVPIALKIIAGASKEMRDRDTGAMNPKHSQIFANVLIGRAKPWIAQLPLAEMK